jgi:hypothetical protein
MSLLYNSASSFLCEGGPTVAVVVDEPVKNLEAQTGEHVGRGKSTWHGHRSGR